jgi:hypothetical protein
VQVTLLVDAKADVDEVNRALLDVNGQLHLKASAAPPPPPPAPLPPAPPPPRITTVSPHHRRRPFQPCFP